MHDNLVAANGFARALAELNTLLNTDKREGLPSEQGGRGSTENVDRNRAQLEAYLQQNRKGLNRHFKRSSGMQRTWSAFRR